MGSKYKGVSLNNPKRQAQNVKRGWSVAWVARVQTPMSLKKIHLGTFAKEEDAAYAYDQATFYLFQFKRSILIFPPTYLPFANLLPTF
jgi:hypothetical protein